MPEMDSGIWAGIPKGWIGRLYNTGDLDIAAEELEGLDSWMAVTLLAMVLSVQGKFPEATALFRSARRSARLEADSTKTGRLRRSIHRMLDAEHRIVNQVAPHPSDLPLRKYCENLHRSQGEERKIMAQRIGVQAALYLCHGKFLPAYQHWTHAIDSDVEGHGVRGLWLIGRAVCSWQIGKKSSALRDLDRAGLHTMADGRPFATARNAARLAAVYEAIGRNWQAQPWLETMRQAGCPSKTVAALERRADLLILHSKAAGYVVLF